MKNTIFILYFILLCACISYGQEKGQNIRNEPHESIEVLARSTGRTTGHIADLIIDNHSDKMINYEFPLFQIPSSGGYQGFVTESMRTIIPSGSTVTIPLNGYCCDPDLIVPPAGTLLPPMQTWDIDSPLLPAIQLIRETIVELQRTGELLTPLSSDPEHELGFYLQQFTWIFNSTPETYNPCSFMAQITLDELLIDPSTRDYVERHQEEIIKGMSRIASGTGPVPYISQDILRVISELSLPFTKGRPTGHLVDMAKTVLPPEITQPRPALPSSHPEIVETVKIVGTGRTTGHIADLTITNPTKEPITVVIGDPGSSFQIPSDGQHQAYIVPSIAEIPIGPGQEVTVPIEGYCIDLRRPPVGDKKPMPGISEWIQASDPAPPDPLGPFGGPQMPPRPKSVTIPTKTAPPLSIVSEHLQKSHDSNLFTIWDCPDLFFPSTPLIPGTETPIRMPVNTDEATGIAVPILTEALKNITQAYDLLQKQEVIKTPFSKNRDKEREAVIQQTFWMYSSALQGEPYEKEDFHHNTVKQFESNTNQKYDELPDEQKEKIDVGIDDFWDSFSAVGVEAKILPSAPELPHRSDLEDIFGGADLGRIKPHTARTAQEAAEELGPDAYAGGDDVEFGPSHDPHTLAEEPAHAVQEERSTAPITEAEDLPCDCMNAEITKPLRIETEIGNDIDNDSIGWHVGGLKFYPPELSCPCPKHCHSECFAEIAYTPVYTWRYPLKTGNGRRSENSSAMLNFSNIAGKGYVDVETIITNRCGEADCHQILTKRIHLTEANDCCDQIRRQNDGRLRFSLGRDGSVEISGKNIFLQLHDPYRIETIQADFNIEAVFCNLSGDRVYSELIREMTQASGDAGTSETTSSRNASMTHNSGGRGTRSHYTLRVMQSTDGREFSLALSMDEQTCSVDLSIYHKGRYYEVSGPPNISLQNLSDLINQNDIWSDEYWDQVINQIFELMRHEHDNSRPDSGVSTQILKDRLGRQMQRAITYYLRQNIPAHVRQKLQALSNALRTGDLGRIVIPLIPLTGTQGMN